LEKTITIQLSRWTGTGFRGVRLEPDDIGFQLGDVVFKYGRTFSGKSFTWEEHVDRL